MQSIKKKGPGGKKSHAEPQINTLAHKAADLYSLHSKNISIAVAVIAAMLIIAAAYSLYKGSNDKKASALLATAQDSYHNQAGPADYTKALELYRTVLKQYPRTMSGAIAQYYIGNCLANMNQAPDALKEYEAFVKNYSGEKDLLGQVYQRIGYAYNMLGNQAEAVKAFEMAEKMLGPGIATMELARTFERMGNTVDAQNKYKVIMEKLSNSSLAAEAQSKMPQGISMPPAGQAPAGK